MVEFLKWTRELRDLMRMKVMMVHYVSQGTIVKAHWSHIIHIGSRGVVQIT